MIEVLSTLLTKAVGYRNCRLASKSVRYDSILRSISHRMRTKLDAQMKTHTTSGQKPVVVLGFLARFRTACDYSRLSEEAAVRCVQYFLIGKAHTLLQSRLAENTVTVDSGQFDVLGIYLEVASFLLRTCVAHEVMAETCADVVTLRQGSNMREGHYFNHPWNRALRAFQGSPIGG